MTARRSRLGAALGVQPRAALALMRQTPALARLQAAWAVAITATWISTVTLTVSAYVVGVAGADAAVVISRTFPSVSFGTLA